MEDAPPIRMASRPLPGIVSSYTHTPYVDMYVEDGKAYLSMPVESWMNHCGIKSRKARSIRSKNGSTTI